MPVRLVQENFHLVQVNMDKSDPITIWDYVVY